MKTRKFFSLLAAVLAVAVACEPEVKLEDNGNGTGNGNEEQNPPATVTELKVNAVFADPAFSWEAGDAVAFLQIDEDVVKSNELEEGGAEAEFFLDTEAGPGAYRVAYPYSDDLRYGVNTFAVPGNQVQAVAGKMNKANALFFSAEDAQISADDVAEVQMGLVGSVICFEVYGGATGETVWSAGVSASENLLAGELTVAADLTVTATPDYHLAHVDLTTAADASVAEGAAQKLYLVVLPAENVETPTYFVMTDKGKYEFYTETAETFANGAVKTVKLNLAEADAFGAASDVLSVTIGENVYTEQTTAVTIEIPYEGAPVDYTLDAWVASAAEGSWYEVKAYNADWSVIVEEFPTIGVSPERVVRTFTFSEASTYYVYLYAKGGKAEDGSDLYVGVDMTIVLKQAGAETNPPTAVMDSAAEAVVGETYTLSITFSDDSGLASCWPAITVSTADGHYPPVYADNYNGWWPELTKDSITQTVTQQIVFDQPGEYKVQITKDLKDVNNNDAGVLDLGTITVTGEALPEEDPDTVAPAATLKSAATAKINEEYTLEIEFFDEGGFKQCWPKVSMYGNADPWPSLIDNDWWEMPTGTTTYTYSKTVIPTVAGTYVIYLSADAAITDKAGNVLSQGELFTVTVTE